MKRLRFIAFGVRLAVTGGRPAWTRIGLMALGFAVGSALLLAATSVVPAIDAREDREYGRYGSPAGAKAPDHARVWSSTERVHDLRLTAFWIEPQGEAPVPPGLPRLPAPGELFASPAVLEWSDGATVSVLQRRLGADVVGPITPRGLVDPTEAIVWVGKPDDASFPAGWSAKVDEFVPVEGHDDPLDLGALLTIVGIAAAVLIPVWLFVATATRLSAATRERRLAAVRLAGATESQVRLLASLETGIAAAGGTLAGIPIFLAGRPALAGGFAGVHFFTDDFTPPVGLVAAIVLALPAFAIAMSLSSIRRLIVSPLGVVRPTRRGYRGARWLLVLALGTSILSWVASQHAEVSRWQALEAGLVIVSALACIAFGLVGTSAWVAWLVARRSADASRSVAWTLGMRRLETDPGAVGRVVGGVALLVATTGALLPGVSAIEQLDGRLGTLSAPWVAELDHGDLILQGTTVASARRFPALAELPGVTGVDMTKRSPYGGRQSRRTNAVVHTDGAPGTIEAVRDELPWGVDAPTAEQFVAEASNADDYAAVRLGLVALAAFLLMVNGASMLLAMIDWIMERRRALAALSALGVPEAVIRRSIVAQVAVPLSTSVVFGVLGAVIVTWLFYVAVEMPVAIRWWDLSILAAAGFVMALAVTTVTLPWLRVARRPEMLRNE